MGGEPTAGSCGHSSSDASFVPTWNWAAALATPFWFLYRKMYLWFALFFFAPQLMLGWLVPDVSTAVTPEALLKPENEQALLVIFGVQLSVHLAAGGVANWLLFRRASHGHSRAGHAADADRRLHAAAAARGRREPRAHVRASWRSS